ncbi:MAG: glycosyltransferase family 2 protein [Opitutales bacterium]|nr:glycosyltransferase family 2 protein [Opitutales bacterium]
MDISIILPLYNEQETLPTFFAKLNETMSQIPSYSYEVICVNDASTDNTPAILNELAKGNPLIKVINFSRNFGKEAAMMAALKFCSGNCAIPIDADLQDPPSLIIEFVKKWQSGYDVVYGVRKDRTSEGLFRKLTAGWFYKIYNILAERPIPYNTGDYRLMSRKVIDAVLLLNERGLFMKGLFNWVGFKSCAVEYVRPKRVGGKSKWNNLKLWNFALDGIVSASTLPIRIWSYVGCFMAFISFFAAFCVLIFGEASYAKITLLSVLFLGGIQLIALGILGEYIGRIFKEAKQRPRYIIESTQNL